MKTRLLFVLALIAASCSPAAGTFVPPLDVTVVTPTTALVPPTANPGVPTPPLTIPEFTLIPAQTPRPPNAAAPLWGVRTKTSGCVLDTNPGAVPDPGCTPGDIFPDVTAAQVCVSGYSGTVRHVTTTEKNQVYAEYGVIVHTAETFEVDHFVSLELGGSNDISNLWPEPASPTPGFHQKDQVENYLHKQVCSGAMTLHDAQVQIATDWLSVYNQIQNTPENAILPLTPVE